MTVLEQAKSSDSAHRRAARGTSDRPLGSLLARLRDGDDAVLPVLPFAGEDDKATMVDGLLEHAFAADACPERRATLASLAAGLSSLRHTSSLLRHLDHHDEHVRVTAATALGSRGNASAVKPLLKAARDASGKVRAAAIRALVDVGGADGGAALARCLEGESELDEDLRRTALHGLREASREHAEPTLLAHLSHSCLEVRLAALAALRDLPALSDTRRVHELLSDADVRVRLLALSVLERHGASGDLEPVRRRLDDDEPRVRAMARDALRAMQREALL